MVSFDVSSFFTNIPLEETVSIILDSLSSETDIFTLNGCSLIGLISRNFLNLLSKIITLFSIISYTNRSMV